KADTPRVKKKGTHTVKAGPSSSGSFTEPGNRPPPIVVKPLSVRTPLSVRLAAPLSQLARGQRVEPGGHTRQSEIKIKSSASPLPLKVKPGPARWKLKRPYEPMTPLVDGMLTAWAIAADRNNTMSVDRSVCIGVSSSTGHKRREHTPPGVGPE